MMITIASQLVARTSRDMRPTSVYQLELVPGKTAAAGAFDSYALLYAVLHNGMAIVCSMSCTNRCLALGDSYGLVHIVNERSYRIFNNKVCVVSTVRSHGSNRPLLLFGEESRDRVVRMKTGVVMLF